MNRDIIAKAKVFSSKDLDGNRLITFQFAGSIFCINWWEKGFNNEKDQQSIVAWFKQHSFEMKKYTSNEIMELLTSERLTAILDVLQMNVAVDIPNDNWNAFFINKELKCTHSKAKFIRMALVCPACGFVGGI